MGLLVSFVQVLPAASPDKTVKVMLAIAHDATILHRTWALLLEKWRAAFGVEKRVRCDEIAEAAYVLSCNCPFVGVRDSNAVTPTVPTVWSPVLLLQHLSQVVGRP